MSRKKHAENMTAVFCSKKKEYGMIQTSVYKEAAVMEKEITPDAMQYSMKNDLPANTGWNQPSPNFSFTMHSRPECALAFSLENTYFGTTDNKVSGEKLVKLGQCFAHAAKKYMSCAQK